MNAIELDSRNTIIKSLASEAPRVIEILRLIERGYSVAFAPDFSEIHSYILPMDDIIREIFRSDDVGLERQIRYWYAAKLLLENRDEEKLILLPYWAEMSQKLEYLKTEHARVMAELSTSGRARDDLRAATEWLVDEPVLREEIIKFSDSPTRLDARQMLSLAGEHLKPLGILVELISGNWKQAFDRLDSLWKTGLLKSADEVLAIDARATLKSAERWAKAIEEIRQEDVGRVGYRYASYIDGWAIECLIRANAEAVRGHERRPLLFLVSRASRVKTAVERQTMLQAGHPPICFQSFWSPDTFLAYQVIRQIPNADIDKQIKAADELRSIGELWEDSLRGFDYEEIKEVSGLRGEVWSRVNDLAERVENISIYRADMERWGEREQSLLIGAEDLVGHDVVNFVRALIRITKSEYETLVEDIRKELDSLWRRMEKTDEEIIAFQGVQAVVAKPPVIHVDHIEDMEYTVADMPGQSIWTKFRVPIVLNHIKSLVESTRRGDPRSGYLSLLEEMSKDIGATVDLNPEYHLLVAVLQICLVNYAGAHQSLATLECIGEESLAVEVTILRLALSIVEDKELKEAISAAEAQLERSNDPRLLKMLGLGLWKLWTRMRSQIDLLDRAIKLTKDAQEKVTQTGQFRLECLNNLAYFYLELYDFDKERLSLDVLESAQRDLDQSFKHLGEKRHTEEISHTIGKIKTRLAWATKDLNLMDSGIKDMEEVSLIPHKLLSYVRKDLTDARQMRERLAAELASERE